MVEKDGTLTDITTTRDIGFGAGNDSVGDLHRSGIIVFAKVEDTATIAS